MLIQKRCLECYYCGSIKDEKIIGKIAYLCLKGPPSPNYMQVPQGMAIITNYPPVGADSISCSDLYVPTIKPPCPETAA